MSPTSINHSPAKDHLLTRIENIKDYLSSKRVILCYDSDIKTIHRVLSAYQQCLLSNHLYWSNNTAIVFFTSLDTPLSNMKDVYFYPNVSKIDIEYRDLISLAAVNIIIGQSPTIPYNMNIPTIVSHFNKNPNCIQANIDNKMEMATIINDTLYTKPLNTSVLLNAYRNGHKRLFLFDYDGTLTPIVSNPADAQPTPTLLHNLDVLCKDPSNVVWIISGRDQTFLDTYLGKIPRLGLSAEHGSFMKKAGLNSWTDMLKDADMSWKNTALAIFQKYTHSNPGTVIEQKKSSITWHYRNAVDTIETAKQSELCHQELLKIPGVDILVGKMNLEVRSLLVNKGEVVKRIREQEKADFIMCAGDDQTDEDMFRVLKGDDYAFCVSVGPLSKITLAKYCVEHSEDVVNIIGQLVSTSSL